MSAFGTKRTVPSAVLTTSNAGLTGYDIPSRKSHEARVPLNSAGLTPTAASTAVSAAPGVWLRRVLLAVAAFEALLGLIDLAVFVPDIDINARLFIHPVFAIAALVLAVRRYLRGAMVGSLYSRGVGYRMVT